jgi:hypothetical protein
MSKQTSERGTFFSPSSRWSSYTGSGGALLRLHARQAVLLEEVPRVLLGEVDELAARAALRHQHPRAGERLLERRPVVEVERHEQLVGALLGAAQVAAGEEGGEHVGSSSPVDVLEEPVVAGEQLAAADAHHRDARVVAVARVADHVAVAALELEHHRRLLHALEVAEGVAKLARALEIEPLGGLLHARRDAAHHLVGLAVEEDGDLVDHRPVVLERLVADARGLAALDREVEAGALGHLARHVVVARPHREDALDDVQRLAHPPDVGVRTEVARPSLWRRRVTNTRG